MEGLAELLDRVKAAKGPTRELDRDIHCHFRGVEFLSWDDPKIACVSIPGVLTFAPIYQEIEQYTASIDAALALTERILPQANCKGLEYDPASGWSAYVSRNNVTTGHWLKEAYAPTPALALLSALLSGIISQENGNG